MPTEKLTFTGHAGHSLAARLDRPSVGHLATAVFAHCFTCGKDIAAARRISDRLAAMGIAVLRFDFTGLGHSQGEFSNTHFTSNVDDLVLACRHMETLGHPVGLLIGHSLGGAAVLKAAAQVPSARAVVTIGAPCDPGHVAHHFARQIERIRQEGEAEVDLGGRPFTIRRAFLEDISAARLGEAIRTMRKALLVLHAPTGRPMYLGEQPPGFALLSTPTCVHPFAQHSSLLDRSPLLCFEFIVMVQSNE